MPARLEYPPSMIIEIARSWARRDETLAQIADRLGWPQSRVSTQINRLVWRYRREGLDVDWGDQRYRTSWAKVVLRVCDHYDREPSLLVRLFPHMENRETEPQWDGWRL